MHYADLDELLAALPALAEDVKEQLAGRDMLVKLEIGARQAYLKLQDGRLAVLDQCADKPQTIVCAEEGVLMDMISGRLSPMKALFTGKVRVNGNSAALISLLNLLKG